ncbi:Prenylcysteine oxidase [Delitschia confertaspora ATCC 74209]|uniref:Prenylcysteine oxidase n=1 Tax=Delitschia confertaspora ATCC 74209 TaxID=1513339 RepID=A0A9P4MUW8_9PLEO|nr:Prenylcysteine oxidase [Delitschia confertaspora ATCC 74209]
MQLSMVLAVALSLPLARASHGQHSLLDKFQGSEQNIRRVAVIGAGAGGSSTAYHLRQYVDSAGINTNITIFERAPYIGGRTTTVNAWSDPKTPIELGGSIFVSVNYILNSAVKEFNLSLSSKENVPKVDNAAELGIWNGNEIILQIEADVSWWEKAKLLWRYGLAPIKTNRLMKSVVGKFLEMYEEPIFPFHDLNYAAYKLGLTAITAATGQQYLEENGIGEKFAKEVIQASTRVNYAQNLPLIHGLETMVCMATDGAMSVEGGNFQIFSQMVKNSGAKVLLNTTVEKITKQPDGTYILTAGALTKTFDEIVLAGPLQFSSLTINPAPKHVPDQIPYVNLHVTLFASPHKLSPEAFNLAPGQSAPQFILTTLPPDANPGADPNGVGKPGFFSISVVGQGANPHSNPPNRKEYIYKIFSPEHINATFLSKYLGKEVSKNLEEDGIDGDGTVSWIYRKLWHSYPYAYPRVTFEKIRLDDGLWYTGGIESLISTMETSALMGKNVAKLLVNEWISAQVEETEDEKIYEDAMFRVRRRRE